MRGDKRSREPGGFAQERFRRRRRNWLKRVWWALPILLIAPLAAEIAIALALRSHVSGFLWGFAIGISVGAVSVLLDSPPSHISRWRTGAEGERATAKALRPLVRAGWTAMHDIPTEHGNIDHILIGPPGVFMVESKNLNGVVAVAQGRLRVHWHEDLDDGYETDSIAKRARAAAAEVHRALREKSISIWVQPLVVLWADFPQATIQSGDVAWVRGRDLVQVLRARPKRLAQDEIDRAAAAAQATLGQRSSSPTGAHEQPRPSPLG